jgi:hypothetical protein
MLSEKISAIREKLQKRLLGSDEEKIEDVAAPEKLVDVVEETASADSLEPDPTSCIANPPPLFSDATAQTLLKDLDCNEAFWGELGTRLWRAERQLHRLQQVESSDGIERLARRFDEITETLRDYGIEILDHTGEKYDAGLTLKVLQYEPQDSITNEVIKETVKPSVRIRMELIPGEVIVATPIDKNL